MSSPRSDASRSSRKPSAIYPGYNVRVVLVIQTPAQLREVYGIHNAETMLKSLAARIVFAPKDFADAREISDELGFTTVTVRTVSKPLGATLDGAVTIEEPERQPTAPGAPPAAGGEGARHRGGHRVLRGAAADPLPQDPLLHRPRDFASACCRRRRLPCPRAAAPRSIHFRRASLRARTARARRRARPRARPLPRSRGRRTS